MNSFERRIRAFSIDVSMATVLFLLLIIVANLFESWSQDAKLLVTASVSYFGSLIVPNFFNKGQSFGKRTQKMMVVNIKTETPPHLIIIILREVVKGILMIGTFGFYLMICGIIVSSRKDGRVIHDFFFKTKVICLTRYVGDKEGSVLTVTPGAKKRLEGSSYD